MLRQYGARPYRELAFLHCCCKARSDGLCLHTSKLYDGVLQSCLCSFAPLGPLFGFDLEAFGGLTGLAKPSKLPRCHKIGPRAAWIVRQPETVRSPNYMIGVDHLCLA